jgi:GNAT superfamily N-acetyltransferase
MNGIGCVDYVFTPLPIHPWLFRPLSPERKHSLRSVWRERAAGGAVGEDRVTFIAEQDGRWIGLATGVLIEAGDPMLVGMFVDGTSRRRGVAAALIESVVGWSQSRGATRLVLWVTSSNEPAIALYRRRGFRPTGKTRSLAHTPNLIETEMIRELHSSAKIDGSAIPGTV